MCTCVSKLQNIPDFLHSFISEALILGQLGFRHNRPNSIENAEVDIIVRGAEMVILWPNGKKAEFQGNQNQQSVDGGCKGMQMEYAPRKSKMLCNERFMEW